MSKKPTISIILYKSKVLKNGEHPLMLRITQNRKSKYISIGVSCDPKHWNFSKNKPKSSHPNPELIETIIGKRIQEYHDEILQLQALQQEITTNKLVEKVEKTLKHSTLYDFFDEVIQRFKDSAKLGTAKSYKDTYNSLKKYLNNKDIYFSEIDHSFLSKYETYLRSNGLNDNSLGVYFRTLRALYNKAIMENIARKESYPFDNFKVSKFKTKPNRRAITKVDIENIISIDLSKDAKLEIARQYFLFSYYGHGINFMDIANLKWKNVHGNRLFYHRIKTGKEFNFKLLPPALKIIEYWKIATYNSSEDYIFPILNKEKHKTPTQKNNRINKIRTQINQRLKTVGEMAEIDTPLTTYVARHTFATVLKRGGVSTSVISEMMGHHSESVTQTYLKSFENDVIDKAAEELL